LINKIQEVDENLEKARLQNIATEAVLAQKKAQGEADSADIKKRIATVNQELILLQKKKNSS